MDRIDRERLKQVQQTDLTESRINEEFLDWLKTKGPSYLLAVLVVFCAWVGWERYKDWKAGKVSSAFTDLGAASLPQSYEIVAQQHEGVRSVPEMARLRAAQQYLEMVRTGRSLAQENIPGEALTDEERADALAAARRLFGEVLAATKDAPEKLLFAVNAEFGLASVAESTRDLDEARAHYEAAAALAEGRFDVLAEQARARQASLDTLTTDVDLPSRESLPRQSPINPLLRDLIPPAPATDGGEEEGAVDNDGAAGELPAEGDAGGQAGEGAGDGE